MTLLLGPPGCGKTTMLLALSGKLSHSLKVAGEMSYNDHKLEEFVPQKSSAYVSQYDLHIPEMTVRETIDFSARCQGAGSRAEIMMEVSRREKQAGILPDSDVDAYMKAISVEGLKSNLQTDYILKILGLDICADTMVGDAMRRGISGGQKKRLTTGEMVVGPTRALFMDEISNGLDSSTTLQIISCLQHLSHIMDATVLISLLQPAPETFDLFDDIILMTEGKIVYHGPRSSICKFFEDCGFRCPERKGVADFLQEVISRKDQGQYWFLTEQPYSYVSADQFVKKFKESQLGKNLEEEISKPFDKSKNHKSALSFTSYSLTKWEMFKACSVREFLLMKRNSFIYVFKTTQLFIIASITMTVLLRTRMAIDAIHASYYVGALFYGLLILLVDGFPELQMTVSRLAVFYKHRELCFYPAWAYAIPSAILKVPVSLLEAFVWTALTYYVIGYSPEFGRFLRQFLLLFLVHLTSTSMFRFVASVFQTVVASTAAGSLAILVASVFGGFVIAKPAMPVWLAWGFWISPLTYGEIGLTVNEFLAPRWEKVVSGDTSIGQQTLESRGLNFHGYFYWISAGALIGMTVLFNIGFTMALTFLKPPGNSRAIISREKYNQLQGKINDRDFFDKDMTLTAAPAKSSTETKKGRMVLPFEPLAMTFTDVQYYVDTPLLILMKIGGRIIYSGPLGQRSSRVIEENEDLVKQLSSPTPGSKELHFPSRFPQNGWEQLKACLWKQNLSYWRSPSYNLARLFFMSSGASLFGLLYWQQGKKIKNEQDLFNIVGSMYAVIVFFGINNCSSVLPFVATERTVLYRERFAGMYSSWAYSFAQIFWSFHSMFCTLLFFNYEGMLLVSLTPNIQVAAILASFSYTMLNFFSGFVVPKPHIPKWWLWLYYICPTSWALNGMVTSQYGDVDEEISVFGETKALSGFVEDYFGFHHSFLSVVGVVLIIFPIVTASLFAYFIGRLNFQRR
ncbi:pleiotropic drug resistance protein 3-like isoform X2 [Populus alba x Populus x berolinensis]|uniref:Pleiotropic drug resistance protein 3-like isoform X2 n=1 Tax=Populus alba x Populus x berolinensis TaxID=444605 RepID=A0AAD6PVW5_9ROSI|nr:pleiotropic drug resistance protein 3-like isoform X2 [Populus alba x Populus x berolinensis]KAJ6969564.1 pleiotropic drug resistance protein 3-like isoform X2 [Populus alba x Populus x berolinensis]